MRIEIRSRDGAARLGIAIIDDLYFSIPNIVFLDTDRFKAPDFAEMVGSFEVSKGRLTILYPRYRWLDEYREDDTALSIPNRVIYPASMPSEFHSTFKGKTWGLISCNETSDIDVDRSKNIFTMANISSLYSRSRIFVENVIKVREKVGYGSLIHAPSVADVSNLSLLIYMGIDLLDSTKAVLCAREGYLFFPEGAIHKDELKDKICSCAACSRFESHEDMEFGDILMHNLIQMYDELKRIRFYISKGRLRELVESRIVRSPELLEKFRIMNSDFYEFLEERTPLIKRTKLISTLRESLNYPEIIRFRRRVEERYRKPENAKILLLLPCSAKKPYSISKTHRMFRDALRSSKNYRVVHEVIVTSPLAIVPRELELIYPSQSYDIPVTGHWFEDELEMIGLSIRRFLEKNSYDAIISHLPDELNRTIEENVSGVIHTCRGSPTSKISLELLKDTIIEITRDYKNVDPKRRAIDDLRSIAMYQFGEEIARDMIPDDVEIRGIYPNLRIFREGKQICSLSRERGLLSLTLEGGITLIKHNKNIVEMEEKLDLRGSLLAAGVLSADEDIRIEDEVVITRDKKIYGIGVAKMNGREMLDLDYGEAVKIRHHL